MTQADSLTQSPSPPAGVGTVGVPPRLPALSPAYHGLPKAELVRIDRRDRGTL